MTALLEVCNLVKDYPAHGGGLWGARRKLRAVDGVSFTVEEGETFGLVGESGSGKTTTGRCILRLIQPTSGEIRFRGENVLDASSRRMRALRRSMQMIFQDPYASLNTSMRIGSIIAEPLVVHAIGSRTSRNARVAELLRLVGLDPAVARRYPHEFSGGQRQRISVARALALNPSFIVCDEPVSALDVSVQAQIINLLLDLQQQLSLTYLFIAHDLRLVETVCSRVAVMHRGRMVEMADTASLYAQPVHPYTKALLAAVPAVQVGVARPRIVVDESELLAGAPLREISAGHWAAI